MKNLIFLFAILASFTVNAQLPTSPTYPPNTQYSVRLNTQSYTQLTPTYYHGSGDNAVIGKDTLSGVDTVMAYFTFNSPYNTKIVARVTVISDSVVGHIYFQCSEDNVTWQSATGLTAVCTTCVGASQTLSAITGTKRYVFDVGNTNFPFWRFYVTSSGTPCVAAITGVAIYAGTGN